LGALVRSRRFRLGISQEELAERAGLHRTYIAGIEGGGRNITLKSIEKLSQGLQINAGALLAESDTTPRRDLPSLLLVESDPRELESMMEAFGRARLANEIHIARDGNAALDFLFCRGKYGGRRGEPLPQVVLLDLNLPIIPGLLVLRRLKADKQTQMIQVVVLATSTQDEHFVEAMRLGAATYLIKPVDFQSFSRITPQLGLVWTLCHANPLQ
jgi:CheY-like chemotaxis protein/DNA-binding XRE family transcriptional regulator